MTGSIKWDAQEIAHYFLDGQEVTEAEFRQGFPNKDGVPGGHPPKCWPMRSEALACHPDQVSEMNQRNSDKGIGARYEGDGTCVIPSRADRKKLLKLERFHDKRGGYGD